MQVKKAVFLIPLIFVFSSCLGLGLDITLTAQGSGTIALEYRIAKALHSLGTLDGNERWNTIPVGRADFERTMDRLPGLKLLSFNSSEDERDIIINARMEFNTIDDLLAFLDSQGKRSFLQGNAAQGRLLLILSEGLDTLDPALASLLGNIFDSYEVRMSMTVPGGRTERHLIPISQILTSGEGVSIEFSW